MTRFILYQKRNRTDDQKMTCQLVSWHDYQFGSQNRAWHRLLLRDNPISHQRFCNQLDVKGSLRVTITCSSLMGYSNAFGCSVRFWASLSSNRTIGYVASWLVDEKRARPWLINSVVEFVAAAWLSSAHCHHTHVILGLITCKRTHGTGSSYEEGQRYRVVSDD